MISKGSGTGWKNIAGRGLISRDPVAGMFKKQKKVSRWVQQRENRVSSKCPGWRAGSGLTDEGRFLEPG